MHAFLSLLEKHNAQTSLKRGKLTTLQVNMGNLCNQSCLHCHIEASPQGKNIMPKEIIDDILKFLHRYDIKTLDITGGASELNPHFDYFIGLARSLVGEIIVRSNLTVFFEPGKEYLPQFFKENKVHLICSLPCYTRDNVDHQRGSGAFDKSVKALRILNELGFSTKEDLLLDLVYNPKGPNIPAEQGKLEKDYKMNLEENYRIKFNHLITITNVPIKRFKDYLKKRGEYKQYFKLLKDSFNPVVLDNLMCRTFLSVSFNGRLYDCDFNQALGLALKDELGNFLTLDKVSLGKFEGREIMLGEHCLSCTAGSGSSCQGVLTEKKPPKKAVNPCCFDAEEDKKESVREYYGKVLKSSEDLKTNACCNGESMPKAHREILNKIEPEILTKFYGCGSPLPSLLQDCRVLDLGCGSGRDVYLASFLVGQDGFVIGVDMTDQQIDVATKYKDTQMRSFGFKKSNVDFKRGYIENLKNLDIADDSIDVVISNCVINLSPDKERVFAEIFRVLKPGGELYFSDVFAGRRVPKSLKDDPVLYGECLGGALYIEDFRRILRNLGCLDYRVVSKSQINFDNKELEEKAGMIGFYSMTIRAFKLEELEDICEDYGQMVTYLGTIPDSTHKFILDDHHAFVSGKPELVCGNTASMLSKTRYANHFKVIGDKATHYGSFNCGPLSEKSQDSFGGGCC